METIYQYSIVLEEHQQQLNHASSVANSCFIFNLHFTHHLHLSHPRHVSIPLSSFQDSFFVPSHLLFTHPHDVIAAILHRTGVSPDFVAALVPQVLTFALEVANANDADADDDEGKVVFFNLGVEAVTPFDDREEIERAIREAAGEGWNGVPAREAAVESLKRVKIESLSVVNECSICLEEFESGLEVIGMPCDHMYHKDCIVEWLKRSHSCPLCRFLLPT